MAFHHFLPSRSVVFSPACVYVCLCVCVCFPDYTCKCIYRLHTHTKPLLILNQHFPEKKRLFLNMFFNIWIQILCIINTALKKKALICKTEFWVFESTGETRMYNMPEAEPAPGVGGKLYQPKPILSATVVVTLLEAGLHFKRRGKAEQDRYKWFVPHHPPSHSTPVLSILVCVSLCPANSFCSLTKKEIKQNIKTFFFKKRQTSQHMACQLRKKRICDFACCLDLKSLVVDLKEWRIWSLNFSKVAKGADHQDWKEINLKAQGPGLGVLIFSISGTAPLSQAASPVFFPTVTFLSGPERK